jgi:hypothetical protein
MTTERSCRLLMMCLGSGHLLHLLRLFGLVYCLRRACRALQVTPRCSLCQARQSIASIGVVTPMEMFMVLPRVSKMLVRAFNEHIYCSHSRVPVMIKLTSTNALPAFPCSIDIAIVLQDSGSHHAGHVEILSGSCTLGARPVSANMKGCPVHICAGEQSHLDSVWDLLLHRCTRCM